MSNPDFIVENHGSIILVRPLNLRAWGWAKQNCITPKTQVFNGGLTVEPRYVTDLVRGARDEGLRFGTR